MGLRGTLRRGLLVAVLWGRVTLLLLGRLVSILLGLLRWRASVLLLGRRVSVLLGLLRRWSRLSVDFFGNHSICEDRSFGLWFRL